MLVELILGGVAATGLGALALYSQQIGALGAWRDAAVGSRLRVVEISSPWAWRPFIKAKGGPLEVRIEYSRRHKYGTFVSVTVPGPPGFAGVRLRREWHKPLGLREIEVGDKAFDCRFFVEGPMRLLFTLLNAEARHLLVTAHDGTPYGKQLEIGGGDLRAETSQDQLPVILPTLLELGRRFAQPVDVARRLADNASLDPVAETRLRNLLLLVREFPGEPGTLEALRAACSDPSQEIRLRAAKQLGAEGREVLMELAGSEGDDALSAQAVSVLGTELPFERAVEILDLALRRRRLKTASACLESLGRGGDAQAVDWLVKVLSREKGELAVAAARALGEAGNPAAEPPLLQALQREKPDLQVAAANALARLGTAASVLPLKEAADSREPELRRAARQAVAEIQSRLQGATPGQLSLAGEEAGQLSLADAEAGQLSLATDPGGQLSLPPGE